MQINPGVKQTRTLLWILTAGVLLIAAGLLLNYSMRVRASSSDVIPDSSPERGRRALVEYGCTGCHMVPGIYGADALVGPPLIYWADRQYIAGRIPNTPDNLVSWIMAPQSIVPGSAMPDMDVTWGDARDIAAYLYSLKYNR
jgi:cytochrome c